MMNYVNLAYKVFGGTAKSLRMYFLDVRDDLQKSGMNYTLDEYISTAIFTSVISMIIESLMLSFVFAIIGFSPITSMLLSVTLSLAISGIIFFLFYSYPKAISKTKGNKIKKVLPFSTSYMATMSSSKVSPITIFKTLSEFEEYGEMAAEAKNIVRDVEMFGMTFSAAVKKQAKRTPSREFKDLLWGISTIVSSGGDLTTFLKQKSEEFMGEYRRRIRKYSQDLSLFVEIYLTLIITGSIFFIILSSVISSMSNGPETVIMQSFIVFILLPLLSFGFIILIKSISPTD